MISESVSIYRWHGLQHVCRVGRSGFVQLFFSVTVHVGGPEMFEMIQDAGDQTVTGQTHTEADNRSCSHPTCRSMGGVVIPAAPSSGQPWASAASISPLTCWTGALLGSFSGSCAVTSLVNHLCEDKHGSRHLTSYQFLKFYHMTTHSTGTLVMLHHFSLFYNLFSRKHTVVMNPTFKLF